MQAARARTDVLDPRQNLVFNMGVLSGTVWACYLAQLGSARLWGLQSSYNRGRVGVSMLRDR
ncbi:hypothetical protein JCGZ_03121 [Jatropha curcas]|uniref:Uncharacterized protein n=1 Tax=Jatropha curcas TaxID=180498 RepID=A0A067JGM4_JATCU|nr:hypothetical protein JCGZ_03121 [Jatropha curcas]